MRRADRHAGMALPATVALVASVLVLALAPSAQADDVIYGVVPQDGALPAQEDLKLMPEGGITALRTIFPWSSVEQTQGNFDWSGVDELVRQLTANGIQPFPFFYGTPEWVAAGMDKRKCTGAECGVYPPKSGQARAAFAAFAGQAAKRYGPGGAFWTVPVNQQKQAQLQLVPCQPPIIVPPLCDDTEDPPDVEPPPGDPTPTPPPVPPTPEPSPLDPSLPPCQCTEAHPIMTWQILNEQNSPKYFAPKADVAVYAKAVKAAGDAIHTENPGAEVILGGMWGPSSATKVVTPVAKYLKKFLKFPGVKDSFDSIALHPYSSSASNSQLALKVARNALKKGHAANVGMWITEIGWASGGPKKEPYNKGKAGQAKVLADAYKGYLKNSGKYNLHGIFWYSWRDKPGGDLICTWCGYAGLRAKNGTAKPSWDAFLKVTKRS